jgi:hypothetical protein
MKKLSIHLTLILMIIISVNQLKLYAQEVNTFSYQAVVRDNEELIINQNVAVLTNIIKGSESGELVYSERHIITTNNYGIINLVIGEGSPINSYVYSDVDWSLDKYYIEISIDLSGGESYTLMGVSQLKSVPYANYALDVKNKDDADPDPLNELQTLDLTDNTLSISDGNSVNLPSSSSQWQVGTEGIYYNEGKVGIGKDNPIGRFEVKGDPLALDTDPLFQVISQLGDTVFAVYNDGVVVSINDQPAKGKVGGFAISGRSPSKGVNDYFSITPDSARVYVNEPVKGKVGGFAVSGRSPSKAGTDRFMDINKVNCSLGYLSGFSIDAGTNNLFLGTESGYFNNNGNYNSFFGYRSGYNNIGGSNNLFLGYESGFSNTSGSDNTFIGYQCGYNNTTGNTNLFIGYRSGYDNTSGGFNLFVGRFSGYSNSTGSYNTFFGTQAGMSNTIGTDNLFIGSVAGVANTSGNYNIFLGSGAGNANTTGFRNTFIGYMSGYNNLTGESNTCFGQYSGYSITDGFYNIYIGTATGGANASGARNITIGDQTLYYNETGYQNTVIGYQSGYNNMGHGNVFLGCYAGYNETTGSNRLYIENSAATKPLIYGEFDRNIVVINGDSLDNLTNRTFYVNGTSGGNFGWETLSDSRLKKNVVTLENSLDKVLKLRGVNFEWKESDSKEKGIRMGFIAQEAEAIVPEVVNTEGEYLLMQYAPITALLVEAIKEQQKVINELKEKNNDLEKKLDKVEDLQMQINDLKRIMNK